MLRLTLALTSFAVLAACNSPAGLVSRGASGDMLAPPGTARSGGVDPRIVGDRLLASGEAELALDAYIRAAAQDGLTPDLLRAMAAGNMQLGYLGQAERLLRDAVEAEPENAAVWNDLGVVLLEKGDVGEAHQSFRRAFALDPNTPQILANLRLSLARLDDVRYADLEEEEEAFTLTRRKDGVFELSAPE